MDTFERYRQFGRLVLLSVVLITSLLARDTTETDWETVTVTDTECSQTCTASTSPSGTLPVSAPPMVTPTGLPPLPPFPPVIISSTVTATSTESAPCPTCTSETTATTTVPVSVTESVPCPSTTVDTTATANGHGH